MPAAIGDSLPAGWTAHLDPTGSGNYYYYNAATGESTWEPPTGGAPGSAPPSQPAAGGDNYAAAWENYNQQNAYFGGHDSMGNLGAGLRDVSWNMSELERIERVKPDILSSVTGSRSAEEVSQWRAQNKMVVSGRDVPNPILTFEETRFPQEILDSFRRQGFQAPTPIQSQGWSVAMTGRDLVGIAKTGSGKTLAFGIPALLHIEAQPRLRPGDGPVVLVLAPTRELAVQIEEEMKKVMQRHVRSVCCYGGAPKHSQAHHLRSGVEVIIATPGRLIDFLENRTTNLRRVTYLVMDEADRMLDMGFEPQIRKILGQVRPDRQTLMWSATWPREVQALARDFQRDYVQIMVGDQELTANADITQHIIFAAFHEKMRRMEDLLDRCDRERKDKIIVFTSTKRMADDLARTLNRFSRAMAIHGDKSQSDRDRVLQEFRSRKKAILVATDVAARGLDIRDLQVVINYDFPSTLEDYVHRIGRTGRAGDKGEAFSFFTIEDARHCRGLLQLLQKANQHIPRELEDMARNPPPPSRKGGKGGRGYSRPAGGDRGMNGGGRDYRSRPY